jgi:CTP pyrophosphohydrolase
MPDFKKESPALSIAAALIQRDGKYLIGQRPEHKPQGGYCEFAGGKLKPGETQRQALVRECREELDVLVQPNKLVLTTEYQYPDRRVTLYFWDTVLVKGTPRALAHQKLAWAAPEELEQYSFCPANEEILTVLRQQKDAEQ